VTSRSRQSSVLASRDWLNGPSPDFLCSPSVASASSEMRCAPSPPPPPMTSEDPTVAPTMRTICKTILAPGFTIRAATPYYGQRRGGKQNIQPCCGHLVGLHFPARPRSRILNGRPAMPSALLLADMSPRRCQVRVEGLWIWQRRTRWRQESVAMNRKHAKVRANRKAG